jgi:PAS domain S-box-containing protein
MKQVSTASAASLTLVAATVLAVAIFAFDTITPFGMAIAVLYVLVLLIAGSFLQRRGILLTALGCAALTALSYVLQHGDSSPIDSFGRCLMSLSAIGVTTLLILKNQSASMALLERASLLDLTHDTVFVRDMRDVITFWNRAAEEMYGWKRDQAIGEVSHRLLQTIFPAPLDEITDELVRTGRWEGELVHTSRNGVKLIVASRWSLQRNERGQPVAILETNNDVTAAKEAEQALHAAQAALAHASRVTTLGELAASIVHEVNQPLAAIATNGDACARWIGQEPPVLDEARDALLAIARDAHRAGEVIRRLRALAQKTDPQKAALEVNDVINDVLLMVEREAQKHHVIARTELANALPPVLGDRVQLQQVVLNLIMNAVDAMMSVADRPRELVIRSQQQGSDQVLIAVQDSGIGFDTTGTDRLFDAFFTTKPNGMGMGLPICRSIIEAHGGRLWASQNAGNGATFQFSLPLRQRNAPPAGRNPDQHQPAGAIEMPASL